MRSSLVGALVLVVLAIPLQPQGASQGEQKPWKADHHVHLASTDLCKRVGGCLKTNHPAAVFAADAISALDTAKVEKGVVLSCAYLYGKHSLPLTESEIAKHVRLENEFTAVEVEKYPDRLIGFLSVDPLRDSALEEIRYWAAHGKLVGLKLHFAVAEVHMQRAAEREMVAAVVAEAAAHHLPMVIHVGGPTFDVRDAELFIRAVLPRAGDSWVQIAHATGGGWPVRKGRHLRVLRVFADHIAKNDLLPSICCLTCHLFPHPRRPLRKPQRWRRRSGASGSSGSSSVRTTTRTRRSTRLKT